MPSRDLPADRIARIASRVSTVELLFDLVFVFTISRVAEIVVHHPDATGIAQAALVLGLVWWMYDAFAWLTNQAAPDTAFVRIALIGAMAAFLVMSLAIPDAFGATGVLFGASYIVVAVIHAALFIHRGGRAAARRMLFVGPSNVLVGVLLVCSGFVEGPIDWVFFALPFALFFISAALSARGGFDPGATHFVERHGLVMIIAFGESIVSVGVGATGHEIEPALVVGAVLAVGLVASLWWCYFTGDDERAERAIAEAPREQRTRLALVAYYLEHLAMIFGLVLVAAGLHEVLGHAFAPVEASGAWLVAGGTAVYLVADAAYRRTLALGPVAWRLGAAALALATVPLGTAVSGAVQLAAVIAIVAAALVAETAASRRPAASLA
ncbi:low temperature requirement protein A [Agromyces endophyticus]|uniref:low temperature requirement protein A n=1 Tax=Agromyces sp. H17E-10 TaxID=2932244 RepID=UPI001FD1556D|nr:low temperature requirement protein A [Agromyces sp. H17E-10]UOQ88564.1 low temperature requirement protein A [Agromyces sp. H17E-10]